MTSKERFDACMALANFGASRHDGRRQYEYRVSLAYWAFLIAAIGYLKRPAFSCQIGLIGAAAFLLYTFVWLRGAWVANCDDKRFSFHFSGEAQKILRDARHIPHDRPEFIKRPSGRWLYGFLFDWAMVLQVALSGILTFTLYATEPVKLAS